MVILFHRKEYQILLPWADHFDLDFFLREGCSYTGEALYDITLRFPKIKSATILLRDLCAQMHYISDALEWLHKGFMGKSRKRVHFAHINLKPDNILIDRDEESAVGKWILTDFGISTFKEDDEAAPADLVSFENLTFRTTPVRLPGAYQPPETEKTSQSSAGRRGDIWAFGCIFAEVLSFALGRGDAVKTFRMSREQTQNMDDATGGQKGPRNDFFYEEYRERVQVNGRLGAQIRQSYRLRSGVDQWLRKLITGYTYPNRTIDCCVQTIRDILEVDGTKRIGAGHLVRKMEHVANHVAYARDPNSLLNCPLELSKLQRPFDPPLLDTSGAPKPEEIERLPSIKFTPPGLDKEDMLFDKGATVASNSAPSSSQQHPHGRKHSASGSNRGLVMPTNLSEPSDGSYDDQSDRSRRSVGGISRANLHGVTINQNKERNIGSPMEIDIPSLRKSTIHSTSLCPSGKYMAYLATQPKDAHQTVLLCKFSLSDSSIQVDHNIILPAGPVWKHIVQAGYNFAVWENKVGGTKHVATPREGYVDSG
jgi:serine/threonine protein kinase